MKKLSCSVCGRLISACNLKRHENVCKNTKHYNFDAFYKINQNGTYHCLICGKDFKKRGIKGHIWRCHTKEGEIFTQKQKEKQKDSSLWKRSNQFIKAKEQGNLYKMSKTSREKLSKSLKASFKDYWTLQRRQKHSQSMKAAVIKHPQSYTSANRGRVKQFEYNGIILQGKWELLFYQYCLANNIQVQRNNKCFYYIWKEKQHYYIPDFYLPEFNYYVEIKGFETERDRSKWMYFPHTLIILRKQEIKSIKQNNLLDLHEYKYNK